MNFTSDNVMGASPPVLEALVRANAGAEPAYGADAITARVERRFRELFEHDRLSVFPVATGTAANALALAAMVPSFGLCVCHEEAHVMDDECGAPEFFTGGAKLAGLPGVGGKLEVGSLERFLDALPRNVKQTPASALTISQATECGLVYKVQDIAALADAAHRRAVRVHMDGARFANALVHLGATPAEMTWKSGVDMVSFGATKNGCFAAEAVVVFEPALAETLGYRRKRGGHLLSKARFIAAQLEAYLADDHWLANAGHANVMAARIAEGLRGLPGVRLAWPADANEVFAILPRSVEERLRAAGAVYHGWSTRSLPLGEAVGAEEALVRLVTSFATTEASVAGFLAAAADARRDGTREIANVR